MLDQLFNSHHASNIVAYDVVLDYSNNDLKSKKHEAYLRDNQALKKHFKQVSWSRNIDWFRAGPENW